MATSEELGRKIVTLYGERGVEADSVSVNTHSLERGYALMNEQVQRLAKVATIHSVSHAPMMFPERDGFRVWLYTTIVYSGDVDPVDLYNAPRNTRETHGWNLGEAQTVVRVYL